MGNSWRIAGARILDPATGRDWHGDLFIKDSCIARQAPAGAPVIDAKGLVAVPGLIDLHVHLREPGGESSETVASGTAAAARGGFTTVVAMPNTSPPADTPDRISRFADRARECAAVNVLQSGCLSLGRKGAEAADIAGMALVGAVAFTDDGATVMDDAVMRKAMLAAGKAGATVMDHALDARLAGKGVMHEGEVSRRLNLPGISSEAETRIVARDIALCEETGCAVHIQHVSAAGTLDLVEKARKAGLRVSCEVTPHHLALCDEDVRAEDGAFKMNPPVRSRSDRDALLSAVTSGRIQAFATDHAPHPDADKSGGFLKAHFGIIGLETAVGITHTLLVKRGLMGLMDWLKLWTTGPASVLNRPAPSLEPGTPADITLLDLDTSWVVDPTRFASKSSNTPFGGWTLTGRAAYTFRSGRLAWNACPK